MVVDNDDFGQFTSLISRAGIIDPTYPVKGGVVWLPEGFQFKERVFSHLEMRVQEAHYLRYQFPRLIPGVAIRNVTKHIDNFEDGVFWLRENDGRKLDIFLNPTGECGIYTMLKKWIRQESDLPIRMYQLGTTFRPHRRADVLLNGDEFSSLLEAHSAFKNQNQATTEFMSIYEIFRIMHREMGIPFLGLRRPVEGNKPVCTDMISFETYLPSKRVSFNVGVLYNQGQIYSKAFDVKFTSQDGKKDNTYQVTFGISERGLAAMLDLHRDQHGLRMLPEFAPTQVQVIPVYGGGNDTALDEYVQKLSDELRDYRTNIDTSSRKPGKKFAEGRLKGIPIRLGVSEEDLENKTARVYLRTEEDPLCSVPVDEIITNLSAYLKRVGNQIVADANSYFQSKIVDTGTKSEVTSVVKENLIAKMYWCESLECLATFAEDLPGEMLGKDLESNSKGSCLNCGKEATSPAYYARRGSSP